MDTGFRPCACEYEQLYYTYSVLNGAHRNDEAIVSTLKTYTEKTLSLQRIVTTCIRKSLRAEISEKLRQLDIAKPLKRIIALQRPV